MARRSATKAKNEVEEQVEETTSENTEAPAEETAEKKEKKEETPVDLGPFQTAVNEALTEADESTGDLPKVVLDNVNKVYREIDGLRGKNAARTWLDEQMKAAITDEKNIIKAKGFVNIKDGLTAASGATKAPADPTSGFVNKVASLQLALQEVTSHVPEGVSEDWSEQVSKLAEDLQEDMETFRAYRESEDPDAEEPEVSAVVRQVFKLASGRGTASSRGPSGPRRDVEKHLQQVFEDVEPGGFLTVNEIAKTASAEYGSDRPSAGAVSARLFPKGREPYNKDGIEAVAGDDTPRGARKTA